MLKRSGELLSLAIRSWVGLVPGLVLGTYGLIQTVSGSNLSASFWLFVGALSIAGVLAWVAYQALKERDAAQRDASGGIHFSGPTTVHFGGGSAPTLPPATQSSAGVPDSKRVEINRLVTEHSPVLQDMTFVDKEIVGPAVLVPMDDQVSVIQSYLGIDADAVLWEIPVEREHLSGAIGLERCTFLRCRFINIGVGGPPEAMEHIRRTTPEGPNDALGARTQGQ